MEKLEVGLIELFGLVIAIIALVIGVWHLYEIQAQGKKISDQSKIAEQHAKMLELIRRALPTRHIGQFPSYISPLAEMIKEATTDIIILCDFPAYGSFSSRHDFLIYRHIIEQKIEAGVKVEIICLDTVRRSRLMHKQFAREIQTWDKWKRRTKNRQRLEEFLELHGSNKSVAELTFKQFAALLERDDQRTLEETFARAEIIPIKDIIPIYFWIIDGNRAIFAIPSYSERSVEHGYMTLDKDIISGFKEIRARYSEERERNGHVSGSG